MPKIKSHAKVRLFQRRHRQPDRRGSLYLAVLGVALIVSMIGMSAMTVARLNLRSVSWRQDRREARILADAAVELGVCIVTQDANWRTSFQDDTKYPSTPMKMGNGTIEWKLVDADGDLADDDSDSVRLYGIGTVGQAVYTKSVLLEPAGVGLTSLEVALQSGGNITFFWNADSNQIISSNGSVTTNGSTINSDVEAVGQINGSVNGNATEGITPRQMPGTSVFDYYLNNGTMIDINDLPLGTGSSSGKRMMEEVVLSPGNNPYGAGKTNPLGIYVINCKSQDIRIKLVRLVGTLVLLNTGSNSDLDNDQYWEPAIRNYPVLLVDGDIVFNWHGEHMLGESLAPANYNPPSTPYLGESDTDMIDEYPGVIRGLIYVSGDLAIMHDCVIEGVVVVGGSTTINDITDLTFDPVFLNNPPPGFGSGSEVSISPGSWRREVSD